jgi:hypothetical protein
MLRKLCNNVARFSASEAVAPSFAFVQFTARSQHCRASARSLLNAERNAALIPNSASEDPYAGRSAEVTTNLASAISRSSALLKAWGEQLRCGWRQHVQIRLVISLRCWERQSIRRCAHTFQFRIAPAPKHPCPRYPALNPVGRRSYGAVIKSEGLRGKRYSRLGGGLALSMNRPFCREVLECASPLALFDDLGASESGRGLPQSKTLTRGS